VNPANSHLNHFGGVARAIAHAAGNELINEYEMYKQTNGLLPTSSVMHTSAGKLCPRIEHVTYMIGPRVEDYSDKGELQQVLTSIYYNVIKYSRETLQVSTLALPAISGGIFHVRLESVIKASYTALKNCPDEYKQTSHTPILQSVYFVNNSHAITTTVNYLFQELYSSVKHQSTATSDISYTPAPLPRPSGSQANRQRRSDKRVEEKMQIWTPDFLCKTRRKIMI